MRRTNREWRSFCHADRRGGSQPRGAGGGIPKDRQSSHGANPWTGQTWAGSCPGSSSGERRLEFARRVSGCDPSEVCRLHCPGYAGGRGEGCAPVAVNVTKRPGDLISTNFLFASLIWGSIGVGYFIYGKRQSSAIPMSAGVLMIAVSYFASSAWLMSLVCLALVAAVYVLLKLGY